MQTFQVYDASAILKGTVEAKDGIEAILLAKSKFKLFAPMVKPEWQRPEAPVMPGWVDSPFRSQRHQ